VVAGFHERERPTRVLDVDERCLLPEKPILAAWRALRAIWGPGAGRLPAGGELRVTLRAADDRVILAVEGGEVGWPDDAAVLLDELPGVVAVWHRPSGQEWGHVAGDEAISERWHGEVVPVGPAAFVQVNREAASALHLAVLREVGGPRGPRGLRVVDAYAGLAAYGRRLARHGAEVIALELEPEAVAVARRNAPAGLTVVPGMVEETLADALPTQRLIVNPPRAGLDERVPALLRRHPAERIVYVSCDPATLARDLARLGDAYEVRRVQCFDLFPQTAHVETVVTLDAAPHAAA
jgi:23S rRNA (uracil1939-C5)-methyltransferase